MYIQKYAIFICKGSKNMRETKNKVEKIKRGGTDIFSIVDKFLKRYGYVNYKRLLDRLRFFKNENEQLKKKHAAELNILQKNYQNLFTLNGQIILSIDKNLKIIDKKNPLQSSKFFTELDKILPNDNFLDIFHEREKEYFKNATQMSFTGKNRSEELIRITETNNQKWINFSFQPFMDEKANVSMVYVFISDITQKKKLDQSDLLLSAYENATCDNIFLLDQHGKFLEVRSSFYNILPLSKEKIIGKSIFDVLPKEFAKSSAQAISQSIADNDVKKIQYEIEIDKTNRYFEVKFSPVNFNEVLAIVTDQTDDFLKKNIIKEKDDWFRSIFNTSRDGLVVELNEEITIVNDAFVKLYGYENQNELLGNKISMVHSEESDLMMLDYGKRRLRGEHVPSVYEAKGKRKDGVEIDIEITASIFEVQNQKYIVATNRNISERKNIERHILEQNEELQKINSELDKFVYSASHDLRAPLRSLLGLIYLFRIDKEVEKHGQYLDKMERSILNLDKLIQDIIQYSRNSRLEVTRESFVIAHYIEELLEDLKYQGDPNKVIEIIKQTPDNLIMNTDKFRLGVILNNLLSNAIRYADPAKKSALLKINAEETEKSYTITVEDNGIGIGNEFLGDIFKMFFRAHDKKVGTGLGLYIVKETVAILKGCISVESQVGIGTKFKIELPKN